MARTIFLGNKNYSSWSLRGWLVAKRAGQPFSEEVIPLHREDSDARRGGLSPAGLVPVLRDGDVVVWDSLAIAEYLNERHPEARLWPEDPARRALARSAACQMHSGFAALRGGMPMNVRRRTSGAEWSAAVLADIEKVRTLWRTLRERHGGGGDFLFGGWCIADAFYTPVASRFRTYEVELDGVEAAYAEAVLATPEMREWSAAAEAEPWSIEAYDL
jgi:glutathione S-transferase